MKESELIEALKEEWARLDMNKINGLIRSIPKRLQVVIDADGGSTSNWPLINIHYTFILSAHSHSMNVIHAGATDD